MSQRYVEFLKLVDMFRSGVMSSDEARKLKQDPDWKLKKAFLKVLHEELYEEFFEGIQTKIFSELIPELAHSSVATHCSSCGKIPHIKASLGRVSHSKVSQAKTSYAKALTARAALAKRPAKNPSVPMLKGVGEPSMELQR